MWLVRKVGRFLLSPIRHWRISLALVIALAIGYTVADQVLMARLATQREAILAAGGRLSFRDLALETHEGNNAAVVYDYAASLIAKPADTESRWEDDCQRYVMNCGCLCAGGCIRYENDQEKYGEPLTTEEEARLGAFIEANGKVFTALEEAFPKLSCQFVNYEALPEVLTDAAAVNTLPSLAGVRQLARLAALRAVWEGRHGNVPGAYHWLTVGLHLANGLSGDPLLINGLVSVASQETVLCSLNVLLCENPLPEPVPADFLAELAEAADRLKAARFFEGERCFSNAVQAQFGHTMLRPWLTLNQMATLDMTTDLIDIMSEPDDAVHARRAAEFNAGINQSQRVKLNLFNQHRILAEIIQPALGRSILAFDRGVGLARCARVAVALKQYKQVRGEYPADLKALTPDLIEDIPADPFTGSALHYRREGNGFVLYTVGQDGRDDGGKPGKKGSGDVAWCSVN